MESERAKERKREHHREQRRLGRMTSPAYVERNAVRCKTCGGKCVMPCRLCELTGAK